MKTKTPAQRNDNIYHPIGDGYRSELIAKESDPQHRVLIGIPVTGVVRYEWVTGRYGQVFPCNWGMSETSIWLDVFSPMKFLVAEARNLIVNRLLEDNFEWLFFIDHDVIIPPYTVLNFNDRMLKGDVPVFGGLYFTKGVPSEPLVYRGDCNSYARKWKIGQEVWVSGLGMGCTMIHSSILKALADESESYDVGGRIIKRVFETPSKVFYDPQKNAWNTSTGTEDLNFCKNVMEKDIFVKAGWRSYARKKYPYLIDTKVFCRHIDYNGIQYPSRGEEKEFM